MPERTRVARLCSIEGCNKPLSCKAMCQGHYLRVKKHGAPGSADLRPPRSRPIGDLHTCPRCEVEQPIGEFPIRNGKRRGTCKRCVRADARAWRHQNLDQARRFGRQNYEKHRDARLAYARRHYLSNREQYRTWQAAYYEEHAEFIRAQTKAWAAANPDKRRAIARRNDRRRRARLAGLPSGPYSLAGLLERDGADCVLCGLAMDLGADYPDPGSVTIEHLECISWPGSAGDVPSNVALAHAFCNWSRNDKPHPRAAAKRADLLSLEHEAPLRP